MAEPKRVGVRDVRDRATAYLSGTESIAVCKHDRIIGVYIPMKRDEEKVRRAWDRFGATINQVLEETGLTEDELADMFDIRRPLKG